jgi:homoaconitate hydratase family protein
MEKVINNLLEDNSLSFIEKLLSMKDIESKKVLSGDFTISSIDFVYSHDVTSPLIMHEFESMGGTKIWDNEKFLMNIDHEFPASTESGRKIHTDMKLFANKHHCKIQEGSNCHQYVLEKYASPGMLIVGADSHTNTVGALNCAGIGLGTSDVAFILKYGQTWFKVPKSIRIEVSGKLWPGVSVKDIALNVISTLGPEAANFASVEWIGSLIETLDIAQRAVLTNISTEMGAHNSVVGFDNTTKEFLDRSGRTDYTYIPLNTEASSYFKTFDFNAAEIAPMVALPNGFERILRVDEAGEIEISVSVIGTCTNGRLNDLRAAAQIMKGSHVKPGVTLIVTPNSTEVYLQALKEGVIQTLVEAGAVVTSPGCGVCAGLQKGIVGPEDVVAFAGPRNFRGRLGSKDAKIYLVSPETAAMSALTGRLFTKVSTER